MLMTSIQNTSTPPSTALLAAVNGTKSAASNGAAQAQDRFMTLLVTQMKNQDPLNPMDNAQVTSQMAQLSTVSGIDKLNASLELLMGNMQTAQTFQASSMLGHNVLVAGNAISSSDSGGYFGVDLPVGADKVSISIKDSAGNHIRNLNIGAQSAGSVSLNWDGLADDGTVAKTGHYQFEVTAKIANTSVAATGLSYTQVTSVSNNASGVKLNLSNQTSVNNSDIKEIF
jgi:flagellar basal-body rod modification protein FlgD